MLTTPCRNASPLQSWPFPFTFVIMHIPFWIHHGQDSRHHDSKILVMDKDCFLTCEQSDLCSCSFDLNCSVPSSRTPGESHCPSTLLKFIPENEISTRKFNCSLPATELLNCPYQFNTPMLNQSKPFRWLHVMKTGSSWINPLMQVACVGLPPQAAVQLNRDFVEQHERSFGPANVGGPRGYFPICFPDFNFSSRCSFHKTWQGGFPTGHFPVTAYEAANMNAYNFVGVFRHPKARILSAMNHFMSGANASALMYALQNRILVHYVPFLAGAPADAHGAVERAHHVLRQFTFVALTEEWETSVCLFHRMFGAHHPMASEMVNFRPSLHYSEAVASVAGAVESMPFFWAEESIYAVAREMFDAQLKQVQMADARPQER